MRNTHYVLSIEGEPACVVPASDAIEVMNHLDRLAEEIGSHANVTGTEPLPLIDSGTELEPVTFHRCTATWRQSTTGIFDVPRFTVHSYTRLLPIEQPLAMEQEALDSDFGYSHYVSEMKKGWEVKVVALEREIARHIAEERVIELSKG
jgi:hypothetical protein